MTKVRNLLLIALVMMPAVTLNASSLNNAEPRPGVGAPLQVTGSCWVYMNGRWYLLPC
ncbi:MAG TPA: hypothetical protein VM692_00125 [Gammaproteobacteria bacterium]|nr:hypothetical protein [Gammaproteobacteria bacterium]